MTRRARPTIRCLAEDLVEDWDDESARPVIAGGGLLPSMDLCDLPHPFIRNVATVFEAN